MIKFYLVIVLTLSTMSLSAQTPLIGKYTAQDLVDNKEQGWFKKGYKNYNPSKPIIEKLAVIGTKKIKIVVFAGSWCSDTQDLLPKFFKMLDETKKTYQVDMFFMDRSKKLPDNSQAAYDIDKLPTFIFIEDGEEIGRIVESASESIEKDILKILLKNQQ